MTNDDPSMLSIPREGVIPMVIELPSYRAEEASFEDFKEWFGQFSSIDWQDRDWSRALGGALQNHSPEDRVAIADLLLDHGADPSVVIDDDNINVLHVLFSGSFRGHDFRAEAKVLKRLLDGGADINLKSPRFGLPLEMLDSMAASDQHLKPFYDVVFVRPDIDMSIIVNNVTGFSLGESLVKSPRDDLPGLVREYMERTDGRNA
ncbi:hypothetical protein [Brachybacterium paraconglomeratum]|uniref:hypothetical protein n=1 Tax=Brachybacterium paraconglomeratum TaxID=173362 RepID=UPI0022AEAAE8|nr:hypothetical protein [Brachybacterium paraconglomeratum]MCZ4327684.1 hypothetical protein [Brachybacterium paraconglomeratum]